MRALLTFDDGPAPDTEALLDILALHRRHAVFFLIGERVAERAQTVKRMACEGHALGNHSWDHPDLRELSLAAARDQLRRTNEAVELAAGVPPRYFRPPYGHSNRAIDAIAGGLGLSKMMWNVGTDDWRDPGVAAILASIRGAFPGAVVLLHDGPQGREQTLRAVAEALGDPEESAAEGQKIP